MLLASLASAVVVVIAGGAPRLAVTIDGRPAPKHEPVRIRQGELLRFSPGVTTLTVVRLECRADVHRIAVKGNRWRVPDLPTGSYLLRRGGAGSAALEVTVSSHDAPCPAPS